MWHDKCGSGNGSYCRGVQPRNGGVRSRSSFRNVNEFPLASVVQNGLETKVTKSRKQIKERKNRAMKIRGVKKVSLLARISIIPSMDIVESGEGIPEEDTCEDAAHFMARV